MITYTRETQADHTCARTPSEIERQLNELNGWLDQMEKTIAHAHEKLRLVVSPIPQPAGVNKEDKVPLMSPLGEAIAMASSRLQGYSNQLHALMETVAL